MVAVVVHVICIELFVGVTAVQRCRLDGVVAAFLNQRPQ
jgi:hypothetical protein